MSHSRQLTTFYIGKNLYGIDVSWVQEVTGALQIVSVPLAPSFVSGLINLRGQIATAVAMKSLFGLSVTKDLGRTIDEDRESMSVICRFEGNLVALLVDSIGDVMEVSEDRFEMAPMTVPPVVRRFLSGVYKIDGALLSVVDVAKVAAIASEALNSEQNLESKIG